jgi:hypothetical protein
VFLEVPGLLRVPIPGGEDRRASRAEFPDRLGQDRNHFVTMGDSQRPTRTEIILDINDDQRVPLRINHGWLSWEALSQDSERRAHADVKPRRAE